MEMRDLHFQHDTSRATLLYFNCTVSLKLRINEMLDTDERDHSCVLPYACPFTFSLRTRKLFTQ